MLRRMSSLLVVITLSLIAGVANAWVEFVPLVMDVVGIGFSIYDVAEDDELSDKARTQIERSLKRQLELGLQPLHVIDARTREILSAQGRLELGIDHLSSRLERWGDQLLSGQGALSEQLDALAEEVRDGHELTRSLLKHMMAGELHSGLRNLSDAVAMFKRDPHDVVARQTLASAKSTLVKHIEFLREEERAGRPTPVEHWALLRLSLVSCYLGLGLTDRALAEAEELIALPVQAEGIVRLHAEMPRQIKENKIKFYDERSSSIERRVEGLTYVEDRLKVWGASLSEERARLNAMKRELIERLSASDQLKAAWASRAESAEARAVKREDELAMQALIALSAEYARTQTPQPPCASSSIGCPDITWVTIKGGGFMMGSSDGDENERPVHQARLSSFTIAEGEITVRQYRRCVDAGVCTEPHWDDDSCYVYQSSVWAKRKLPQSFRGGDQPIVCVDWGQARTFSRWVGGDLPTEAQWEYAARGGQSFKYSGSNDASAVGWYGEGATGTTHPMKRKQRNSYGLYNMSGNVWEWTLDELHINYSGAPSDGDRAWGELPPCEVRCGNGSSPRVHRGGSWFNGAWDLRVTMRRGTAPNNHSRYLGFRPVNQLPRAPN